MAACVTIAVCLLAGHWQQRRMQEKQALQAQISASIAAAPVPLPDGVVDWRAWRYRTVTMTGEFDARHQILIDNRLSAGRAGFGVITPFMLDDGRAVLVDRGWVAVGATRATLPAVPPPAGVITVRARIDLPADGYLELGERSPPSGRLWQRLDPQRYAEVSGIAVLPIVVRALETPGDVGPVPAVALPDTGIEKHLSYMLQWYTFAAMTAALWFWFNAWPELRRALRG